MVEASSFDLDEIATALADQNDYDRRWLVDPKTGEIAFWTSDGGLDGDHPISLDEIDDLDLIPIDPLPSSVWYRDMVDFAGLVSDERAARRLERALHGKGAFRRFKDVLYQDHEDLVPSWRAFNEARATRRAIDWLADNGLVDAGTAADLRANHPDPLVP